MKNEEFSKGVTRMALDYAQSTEKSEVDKRFAKYLIETIPNFSQLLEEPLLPVPLLRKKAAVSSNHKANFMESLGLHPAKLSTGKV